MLGPERLPGAIRTVSLWVGKLRRSFNGIKAEIEREIRADEIRQDLHNQAVLKDLRRLETEMRSGLGSDGPAADKYGNIIEEPEPEAAPAPTGNAPEAPGTADAGNADDNNSRAPS